MYCLKSEIKPKYGWLNIQFGSSFNFKLLFKSSPKLEIMVHTTNMARLPKIGQAPHNQTLRAFHATQGPRLQTVLKARKSQEKCPKRSHSQLKDPPSPPHLSFS